MIRYILILFLTMMVTPVHAGIPNLATDFLWLYEGDNIILQWGTRTRPPLVGMTATYTPLDVPVKFEVVAIDRQGHRYGAVKKFAAGINKATRFDFGFPQYVFYCAFEVQIYFWAGGRKYGRPFQHRSKDRQPGNPERCTQTDGTINSP